MKSRILWSLLALAAAPRSYGQAVAGLDIFNKLTDSFNKVKSVAADGQPASVDDLSFNGFGVKFFSDGFMRNRMGEWHTSKIKCRVRIKDKNFGSGAAAIGNWFQDTIRHIQGQPSVPAAEPEYGDVQSMFPQYIAELEYEIVFLWNGQVTLSESGEKVSDESQYLGAIAMKQVDGHVHPDWTAKIAANSNGVAEQAGTRTKSITKTTVDVRLDWGGANWLNRAGDWKMLRGYNIYGNGRADDSWVEDSSRDVLAKKRGVSWTCSDAIDLGKTRPKGF